MHGNHKDLNELEDFLPSSRIKINNIEITKIVG